MCDNYGYNDDNPFDDPLLMATALGLAEELNDAQIPEDDIEEMMALLSDEPADSVKVETKGKKMPPKGSFESWVRDINSGRKKLDDSL